MYTQAGRIRQSQRLLLALTALPILGGAILIAWGIKLTGNETGGEDALRLICIGIAVILQMLLIWIVAHTLIKVDANTARTTSMLYDLLEELQNHSRKLDDVAENVRLSDSARSLSHRQEERNALRSAISTEITEHDWEAAGHFIDEMERRFGFKEEAQRLREQLRREQVRFYETEVERAVPAIQKLFDAHDWERAKQEIGRLLSAFPNEHRFAQLQTELEQRRRARKAELVRDFTAAVQRDDIDIDTGMQILQELDQYLTRAEAQELEASARKVVKGKLLQLGVRFRFAVSEERWRDALEVAVNIIEEFPNSQMANEVRARLIILRERAGLPADVEVVSSTSPRREQQS